jgi:hypothetical protein
VGGGGSGSRVHGMRLMRHERETGKRTYAEAYPFPNPPLLDQAEGTSDPDGANDGRH